MGKHVDLLNGQLNEVMEEVEVRIQECEAEAMEKGRDVALNVKFSALARKSIIIGQAGA